jgi:phosphopentomutase
MKRFVVIVLDGFGIGAMDDVPASRPRDIGSNTCRHIFERVAALRLPTLERLGLGNALLASEQAGGTEAPLPPTLRAAPEACFGFHRLAHFGADTFWGHQELMGTKPRAPETAPFSTSLPAVRAALEKGAQGPLYGEPTPPGSPASWWWRGGPRWGTTWRTDWGTTTT